MHQNDLRVAVFVDSNKAYRVGVIHPFVRNLGN